MDKNLEQTKETFGFKWSKRETYESNHFKKKVYKWLVDSYFGSEKEKLKFIQENKKKSFLDAGCGSGFSASVLFGNHLNNIKYFGVDISEEAIKVAKQRFNEFSIKGRFQVNDISTMKLGRKFDLIFSEGVIHHTSKPLETFKNLISHLNTGGTILFYVYKKKAPIREFSDDYIRAQLKNLTNKEAWNKLLPLTKLGKILGDLNTKITVPEDIDLLKIPKGEYDVQELIYWYFLKIYYDKNFTMEEMNHINFDWYRPLNCYRFTAEEIKQWLKKTNLKTIRFTVDDAGIRVVAIKI